LADDKAGGFPKGFFTGAADGASASFAAAGAAFFKFCGENQGYAWLMNWKKK
jgi:hypothetical protein